MTRNLTIIDVGRSFARGLLLEMGKWLLIGFAVVSILQMVLGSFGYGWDSTDRRESGDRSGVRLRMDYGTGCQYLESGAGSLTPRLDRSGRQVCRP